MSKTDDLTNYTGACGESQIIFFNEGTKMKLIEKKPTCLKECKTTLDFAVYYVHEKKYPVIPLQPKDKKPAIKTWKEFQERLPSDRELVTWFKNKDNNLGIVTGEISGIAVVDLDSEEAEEWAREHGLKETPASKTGRGKHAFCIHKDGIGNFQKKSGLPDIDLRAEGGYAVAPPSVHSTGIRYEWVNGCSLDDLPLADLPEFILANTTRKKASIKKLLSGVVEGSRNESLTRLTGHWLGKGCNASQCLEKALAWNNKNTPPLEHEEVERTVQSICAKHMSEDLEGNEGNEDNQRSRDLVDTDEAAFPLVPFPFDVFPEPFRRCGALLGSALQVEPEIVTAIQLAIISGAIGNSIVVSPKPGYEIPIYIWIILIARSGYGKSPAINALVEPIKRFQAIAEKQYCLQMKEFEAKKKAEKSEVEDPKRREYLVSDTTIEALTDVFECNPRGVLIHKDEISGLILGLNQYKQGRGDDRQHYIELFDAKSWKINRRNRVVFIPNTGASIIGGIQPRVMPKVFKSDSFDDGLLPRFLLLHADDKTASFTDTSIERGTMDYWRKLLTLMYKIPQKFDDEDFVKPKVFTLKDHVHFKKTYNEFKEVIPFISEQAKPFPPKLISYCLKFAGILQCLKGFHSSDGKISPTIDEETVQGAIRLTQYFAGQAVRALKLYDEDEKELTEFKKRLIRVVFSLREEFKHGKIEMARIKQEYDKEIPEKLQISPRKLAAMLRDMGLEVDQSTGHRTFLFWDENRMQELSMRAKLPLLPLLTPGAHEGETQDE